MNNKVLVEIYLPASGKSYDMKIPVQSSVAAVTEMIARIIKQRSDAAYIPGRDVALCDATSGRIYNPNVTIDSLKLEKGSKLLLI